MLCTRTTSFGIRCALMQLRKWNDCSSEKDEWNKNMWANSYITSTFLLQVSLKNTKKNFSEKFKSISKKFRRGRKECCQASPLKSIYENIAYRLHLGYPKWRRHAKLLWMLWKIKLCGKVYYNLITGCFFNTFWFVCNIWHDQKHQNKTRSSMLW